MSSDEAEVPRSLPTVDLRSNAEVIERSFVADNTTDIYMGVLVQILVFLYDFYPKTIQPEVYEVLKDENEKDVIANSLPPPTRRPRKKRPYLVEEHKRKHLRSACKDALMKMKPSIDGSPCMCPIIIEGDNALQYSMLRNSIMNKKTQPPSKKKLHRTTWKFWTRKWLR